MLSELEGILDTEGEAQISLNVAGGEASAAAGDGPWGLLSTLGGILGVREQAVEDVVVPETVAIPESAAAPDVADPLGGSALNRHLTYDIVLAERDALRVEVSSTQRRLAALEAEHAKHGKEADSALLEVSGFIVRAADSCVASHLADSCMARHLA